MKKQILRGFTLIELLIVVAIIAILAAIAVPNFLEAQVRAKVSRAKADMRSAATAIEAYAVDNNKHPSIVAVNYALTAHPFNGPSVFVQGEGGISSRFICMTTPVAYITSVFRDPFITGDWAFSPTSTSRTPLEQYDTYDYVDAASFQPGSKLSQLLGTRDDGNGRSSGAAWHLVSSGPDQRNAFGGGTIALGLALNHLGVDYDPTNGTVSAGDIVRIGGGPGVGGPPTKLPAIDRVGNKYNWL